MPKKKRTDMTPEELDKARAQDAKARAKAKAEGKIRNKKRADMTPEELERAKESDRKKYLKDTEKIIERQKKYDDNHKEEKAKADKSRRQGENREQVLKIDRRSKWVNRFGVKFDNEEEFEAIYKLYKETEFCDFCNCKLHEGNVGSGKKTLDHDHTTGKFRNILCNKCNISRK